MEDAGAVILAFGFIITILNFRQQISVGGISGAAGPVMIIVGSLMLFTGS